MHVRTTKPRVKKPARTVRIPANSREREWAWLQAHPEALDPYVGQWVALEGEAVVGHGRDAAEAANQARRRGISVPYVFFVEKRNTEALTIGL